MDDLHLQLVGGLGFGHRGMGKMVDRPRHLHWCRDEASRECECERTLRMLSRRSVTGPSQPPFCRPLSSSGAASSAASATWKRLATASLPMNDAWTLATAPWTWSKEGNSAPAMDALTATEDLTRRTARPEEPARRSGSRPPAVREEDAPRAPTGVSALERAMPPRLATQAAIIRVTLGLLTTNGPDEWAIRSERCAERGVSARASNRRNFRITSRDTSPHCLRLWAQTG